LYVCGSHIFNLFMYYVCVFCRWSEKCHLRCIVSFFVVLYLVIFPHPYRSVGMAVIKHTRSFNDVSYRLKCVSKRSKFILKHL
jgi:hypothetical protein